MPAPEFTHIFEPKLNIGSRIIVPLTDEMLDKSHALQEAYSDEFGHSHLHLPHRDELSVTFAQLVVAEATESISDVSARIQAMEPAVTNALRQTVALSGEPFEVTTVFDTLESDQSEVSIIAPNDGRMNQLRRLFGAVLRASMDQPVPTTLSVAPIQFSSEIPISQVDAFTNSLKRYFIPVQTTFQSLQLVQVTRPGQPAKVIQEFPVQKKQ